MAKVHLVSEVATHEVTIINRSTWCSLQSHTYAAFEGTNVTIPVTYLQGSDYTCISVSNATVDANGITVSNIQADVTLTITDRKYRVTVENGDAESVDSISPAVQFVMPNDTATFTVAFNTGYSDAVTYATKGTLNGSTLTVTGDKLNTSSKLLPRTVPLHFYSDIKWLDTPSKDYDVRLTGSITIPLSFIDGSDISCLAPISGATIDSSGITVTNVTAETIITAKPAKTQVQAMISTPRVNSVSPQFAYVVPGNTATFTISYASGYSDAYVDTDNGTVSGNTLSVPTTSNVWYVVSTLENRAVAVTIGSNEREQQYTPVYRWYEYSASQMIYTAQEIGMSGKLSGISYYVTNSVNTYQHLKIYVKEIDETFFPSYGEWLQASDSMLVFDNDMSFKQGWTKISFDTAFNYSGNKNLLITVLNTDPAESRISFGSYRPSGYSYVTTYSNDYSPVTISNLPSSPSSGYDKNYVQMYFST